MLFCLILAYTNVKNIKNIYRNNKFKISVHTWSDKFKFPDGSNSVSDIHDYFEYIIKKHKAVTNNPPIRIYINKIENKITYKIKTGCYPKILTPETVILLGSTENKTTEDKNTENVPHLEITEVVLVLCNIVNND